MDPGTIAAALAVLDRVPKGDVGAFVDDLLLRGHHDAFPYTLNDGRAGFIKLSEWPICWSVKWYAAEGREHIMLIDRVNQETARTFFERLKGELRSGETSF